MADIFDKATDREFLDREQALQAHAAMAAATTRPTPTGYCLNPLCGLPFDDDEPERLFCGRECADEHGRRAR